MVQAWPGLLGPSGEWYPCDECEHGETASRIVEERYKEAHAAWWERKYPDLVGRVRPNHQGMFLSERGWLRVSGSGQVTDLEWGREDLHPTQAQMDHLWDMFMDAEQHKNDQGMTPFGDWRWAYFAENMRESMAKFLEVAA
jgi:hypothetical protein